MSKSRSTELRVGIFVVVALLIGGTMAFVIGNQRNLFNSKRSYTVIFENVGGLRAGNAVQVAGVSVGTVEEVTFDREGRVKVRIQVVESAASLIRGNPEVGTPEDAGDNVPMPSVVTIASKGMLGDKLLEISVGGESLPQWPSETPLLTEEGADLFAQLGSVAHKADHVVENVERMTAPFRDQEFSNDVKQMARNLAQITGMLATGDGAVQRLMTDPRTGDEVTETLENLRATSSELARTSRSIRMVVDEVREGDGTAHALVYGTEGRDALAHIGQASDELAQLLGDVRTGDGTMHDLIYEDDADALVANATQVSEDLAAITGEVRAGRGTIGGLLMDPSIYEDVKRLVGDLERNEILRALVRYSIRRDEASTAAEVDAE